MVRGLFVALVLSLAISVGAETIDIPHNQDVEPGPARPPEEARANFTVPPGFHVQCVASEPDLINPVAMTWDDRGRVWVCESVEYPRFEPGIGQDRVRIHEDLDGDGDTDKVQTFVEGLNIPSGIAIGYGGVFVANAPDLLFLRDTNGDDIADVSEVLITGFGRKDVHELPSCLTWGPDGWLYGLNGVFNLSHIEHQGNVHDFTCALWRYHPVSREFEIFCEGTSNPWGLDYNLEGDWFVSACVIDHLWHLTQSGYYHRQGGPYPPNTWKIESIVEHKHQKAAYCGLAFYYADQYPEEYRGDLFMGNIHFGGINRDQLEQNGSTYRAGPQADFMAGNDVWHMPVSTKVGPDGNFWILDWYDRYHCYQDARRDPEGIDRGNGRIWRVTYGGVPPVEKIDLGALTDEQLMDQLGHANAWHRRSARRILVERNQGETADLLKERVRGSTEPIERMECLWALIGMRRMDEPFIVELLADPNPSIRRWAVHAAAERRDASADLFRELAARGMDDDAAVRLAVAIASGRIDHASSFDLLRAVMSHPDEDRLIPHIVWENIHPRIHTDAAPLAEFLETADLAEQPIANALAHRAVELVLDYQNVLEASGETTKPFAGLMESAQAAPAPSPLKGYCLQAVWNRWTENRRRGVRREDFAPAVIDRLRALAHEGGVDSVTATAILAVWGEAVAVEQVESSLVDVSVPLTTRKTFLVANRVRDATTFVQSAAGLLVDACSTEFQQAVIGELSRTGRADAVQPMLSAWRTLAPGARQEVLEVLTRRKAWAVPLLESVAAGTVSKDEFRPYLIRRLAEHQDGDIDQLAESIWGVIRRERNRDREGVIQRVWRIVEKGPGDPAAGMPVFDKLCAQCHVLYGHGKNLGPDISGVGRNDLDLLLSNLLDPNLVIGDGYHGWTVWTTDGEVLSGLLVSDDDQQVVLRIEGGEEIVIPKEEIEEIKQSELSLMPEGLERGVPDQELRDLVSFLLTTEPPRPWAEVLPQE